MLMPLKLIAVFLGLLPLSSCHSWVERVRRVALNGTMVEDPGYIRGAVSRLDPAFNDLKMQHLLLPADNIDSGMLCKDTQRSENYLSYLPALQAQPGDFIALQYQENGHITLPQNDPQKTDSGRVYIYGTSTPIEDETLTSVHLIWNEQGTGGDGRGRLLAQRPFDDGRCYQINDGLISLQRRQDFSKIPLNPQGADLWCQNNFRLPTNIEGRYTLYWVWDWPSGPTDELLNGQQQLYTSCMDVYVSSDVPSNDYFVHTEPEVRYINGQDLNWAAIEEQMVY